jgi:hypothetical protein
MKYIAGLAERQEEEEGKKQKRKTDSFFNKLTLKHCFVTA